MMCNLCPIIHYNSTVGHINRSYRSTVRNYHVVTVYCNIAKCKTSAFNFYQISRCTHSVKRSAARECNIAFDSNCRRDTDITVYCHGSAWYCNTAYRITFIPCCVCGNCFCNFIGIYQNGTCRQHREHHCQRQYDW